MELPRLRDWSGERLGPVEVLPVVDSTNAEALRRVTRGVACDGLVLVAERQEAGRGSRGRAWSHLPGKSIALTALLRASDERPPHLATWAAVVAATDLALAHGLVASIKWPNDGLLHGNGPTAPDADEPNARDAGGKFAGVLVEARSAAAATWTALGVGVNVGHGAADLAGEFRWPPTSLLLHGVALPFEAAHFELLAALDRRLAHDPEELVRDLSDRLGLIGRAVVATLPDREERGRLVAIGVDGRLRLSGPGGERSLHGAHVVALAVDPAE